MVKVLCLHGARQTAEIFEHQLNKLSVALAGVAELDFLDAPCILSTVEGDAVATRLWCDISAGSETESQYAIGDTTIQNHMATHGPYDVVLGFSQGALMAVRYVMLREVRGGDAYGPPLRGILLAGSPDPRVAFTELTTTYSDATGGTFFLPLPSLHIIGKRDTIVNPNESAAFATACGPHAETLWHDHAHSVPQLQGVLTWIVSFLARLTAGGAPDKGGARGITLSNEEVLAREEELTMVAAMYGDDCVTSGAGGCAVVQLPLLLDEADGSDGASCLRLRLTLSPSYPRELPVFDIAGGPRNRNVAYERWRAALLAAILEHLRESYSAGDAVLLPAMMFAAEQASGDAAFLHSVFAGGAATDDEDEAAKEGEVVDAVWAADEDETQRRMLIEAAEAEAAQILSDNCTLQAKMSENTSDRDAHRDTAITSSPLFLSSSSSSGFTVARGGSLELTIGLIGKPSAGKSTFFNAVTDPASESSAARVAAFPFTTIEPNVAGGFAPLLCPCATLPMVGECDAVYGHVRVREDLPLYRRHPITIKDVAGLVRGAYCGRGKGNQFLNDLCDAHVLVHIVDGAAATDADGAACAAGSGSATMDVAWVRAEVHSWIYDNLRARWDTIRRRPEKLRVMFTGYRSPPSFVDALLLRVGLGGAAELARQLPTWGPTELHRLVALYVRARFPIVIALNKADVRPAAQHVAAELRRLYPSETFLPVAAKMECHLLQLRKKGLLRYTAGAAGFEEVRGASADSVADTKTLVELHAFFTETTTTGVQEVLATALERCACVVAYPLPTLTPPLTSLRECFIFRPGTTAGDVFDAMVHSGRLDGKLVRFEATSATEKTGRQHILKRDAVLPGRHVLVRILSNKRQMTSSAPEK